MSLIVHVTEKVNKKIPLVYKTEYSNLVNQFGKGKVKRLFPSGIKGYYYSRTKGNYSMDSIRQNLK